MYEIPIMVWPVEDGFVISLVPHWIGISIRINLLVIKEHLMP